MPAHKDTFDERRDAAAKAKQALLEKFRARPAEDDPAVQARKAERKAIVEARDARMAERQRLRDEEAARLAAAEAARRAEEERLAAEEAARLAEEAANAKALLAQQKAARDARYAARKARR